MKKLFLAFTFLPFALTAQNKDYRNIALAGSGAAVNVGYTAPRVINITNDTTTVLFVKFYDQTTTPFSTSHPVLTLMIPASSTVNYNFNGQVNFTKELWIRACKNPLDADTTYNKWKTYPPIVEIFY